MYVILCLLRFSQLIYVVDGVELMIMIIATFGQALSGQAPAVSIIGVLIVWRFIVRSRLFSLPLHLKQFSRWVSVSVVTTPSVPSSPRNLQLPRVVVVS